MNKVLTTAMMLTMTAGMVLAQGECCESVQKQAACDESVASAAPIAPLALLASLDGQPEVKSHMVMIQQDGEHEYKVEIADGQTKAWVDGERVPKKQLKITEGEIVILDSDGDVLAEFQHQPHGMMGFGDHGQQRIITRMHGDDDGPIVWESDDARVRVLPGDDENMMFFGQPQGDNPPVMIGINMSELNPDETDERTMEFLSREEIDPGKTIVVLSVIDDLPADEAGVRDGDVIVRVDGKWGVDADKLRDILSDKEPGDELELAVVRKGKLREIEVELASWDAEKLGSTIIYDMDLEGGVPKMFQWRGQGDEDTMQELRQRLGELGGDNKELESQLKVLIDSLKMEGADGEFRFDVMPRIQRFGAEGEGGERYLLQPAPRAQAMDQFEERLDRIEDRLERLERRLDRILTALERDRD